MPSWLSEKLSELCRSGKAASVLPGSRIPVCICSGTQINQVRQIQSGLCLEPKWYFCSCTTTMAAKLDQLFLTMYMPQAFKGWKKPSNFSTTFIVYCGWCKYFLKLCLYWSNLTCFILGLCWCTSSEKRIKPKPKISWKCFCQQAWMVRSTRWYQKPPCEIHLPTRVSL